MKRAWKRLFSRIILDRGEDYYLSGSVGTVEKTEEGYHAVVSGTHSYHVNIVMNKSGSVQSMSCSCPYAKDGNHCKHEAAVLFELSGEEVPVYEKDSTENDSLNDILNSLSREKLIQELQEHAASDSEFRSRLEQKYRKRTLSSADISVFAEELHSLTDIFGDRGGYIDYRSGQDYVDAFVRQMDDMIPFALQRGEKSAAFEMLKIAFEELNDVEMDGSNGEHSIIAMQIRKYLEEMLSLMNEEEKKAVFDWLLDIFRNQSDYNITDELFTLFDSVFYQREYGIKRLDAYFELLEASDRDYLYSFYLGEIRRLAYALDCPERYEEWMKAHEDMVEVMEIRYNEAKAAGDVFKEIDWLKRMLEKRDRNSNKTYLYQNLALAYQRAGLTQEEKLILEILLNERKYPERSEISRLKELSDEKEWTMLSDVILKRYPHYRNEFLYREKRYEELMNSIRDARIDEVDRYRETLMPLYTDAYLQIYRNRIDYIMTLYMGKYTVEMLRKYLLYIAEYKEGREYLKRMIPLWISHYPGRRVMREMLTELSDSLK